MKALLISTTVLFSLTALSTANHPGYTVEVIETKSGGKDPQIGGIDVLPDGKLAVAFHEGDIRIYDPKKKIWSVFASGLHEPLGIIAESESKFVVMQRPELTRIIDTDNDGKADLYQTVSDNFGMSGNYHEFAFGPVKAPDGSYIISLNVASNGASVRKEIRGEWLEMGLDRKKFYDGQWGKSKVAAGRMYSRVPYRGWIMKVDPKSGAMMPWALGFRSPNGIGFDKDGNMFVSDNEGDWLGTSPLHHVEKGKFYGHPASLPWQEDYDGEPPLKIPVEELQKIRTKAAIWFPQGTMANSPTQPVSIPNGFGPFTGQILIGEMNKSRIVRVMPEKVNGVMQGACTPFIDENNLPRGVHRLCFGPDASLWTGHTHLSWAGGEGMTRINYNPDSVFQDVKIINIMKDGFKIEFLQPIEKIDDLKESSLRKYTFKYHKKYGSPKTDQAAVEYEVIPLGDDSKVFHFRLKENLAQDYCYEFTLPIAQNNILCYTVREIPK